MSLDHAPLLDPPPSAPLTARERARIEAKVQLGLRRQRIREHRLHKALGVAPTLLVAASVVAVVALVAQVANDDTQHREEIGRPVAAQPAAATALQAASATIREGNAYPMPAPDEFVYVRSVVETNESTAGDLPTLGTVHVREIWLSQTDQGGGGLIREFGQDWPLGGTGAVPPGLQRPTVAYLASLPDDPDALLDELTSLLPPWDDARSVEQVLFDTIVQVMSENSVPASTTATLYEALARIPHVQLDPTARDILGRPGVAVTRAEDVFDDRTVLIIDPATGETIGVESLMSGPHGDVRFGAMAIIQRGLARSAGAPPVPAGAETEALA